MSQDRAAIIAAFLLTPRGRQLREPGARRLACARHCPSITADEIARGIELAAVTLRAGAAGPTDIGAAVARPGRPRVVGRSDIARESG